MKVVFNGGINCSILDGWWDEAYTSRAGWAIGKGEMYNDDQTLQDEVESSALYDLLEKEIAIKFYDRDKEGIPRAWLQRMKTSMADLCPQFNVNRMVKEYALRTYFPASVRFSEFLQNDAERAKVLADWKRHMYDEWRGMRIESVETQSTDTVHVGDDMRVKAWLNLGGLKPEDVSVQIYHGPIDAYGHISDGEIAPMSLSEQRDGKSLFSGAVRYFKSGRHGFTVRVLPHHDDLGGAFETGLIQWAGAGQLSETPKIMQSV
jgi:starch phosphorylase